MGGLQSYLVLKAGVRSRVDALAYQPDDVHETICGICFIRLGPEAGALSQDLQSVLYRLSYLAGFFRKLIAIFPSTGAEAFVKELKESLKLARRGNVMLLSVEEAADSLAPPAVTPLHTPARDSVPVPDCRGSISWERVIRAILEHNARRDATQSQPGAE